MFAEHSDRVKVQTNSGFSSKEVKQQNPEISAFMPCSEESMATINEGFDYDGQSQMDERINLDFLNEQNEDSSQRMKEKGQAPKKEEMIKERKD